MKNKNKKEMEKKNIGAALLALLLQLLWLKTSLASKPRPDCPKKCGNTDIPYPFGINDAECFRGETFHLTCNSTYNPPKAFWGHLEVLQISLQGEMTIGTEISYDCYNSSGSSDYGGWSTTLAEDRPFTFSDTRNKFTGIGCDTIAYITGSWGPNFTSGCVSYCGNNASLTNGSCSGIGCCQTSIPKGVKKVKVSIDSTENHTSVLDSNPCGYAILVDESRYTFLVSDMKNESLQSRMSTVPTVLDWAIKNETCELAKHARDYACVSGNSFCNDSDNGYRCNCSQGYEGNPYIDGGCKDIDECFGGKGGCQQRCENLPGNYRCACQNGYYLHEDGKTCIKKKILMVVLGISVGVSLLLLLIAISWSCWAWKKRKVMKHRENIFQQNGGLLLQEKTFKIFTIDELMKATNNYNESQIVGQGGYGVVYKGVLSDKRTVAIKKPKTVDANQIEQFINEVHILSQINHRNVVKLLGCCLEAEVPLLVYEFVSNGTLHSHIHGEGRRSSISWENRLRIAIETSSALYYLHSAASIPIFHRDVKSTNILLDDTLTVKVSDFGASRLVPLDQTEVSTLVRGTIGYLDPEYFHTGQLTEKSDVYSFGVVLAELLTGEKPLSSTRSESSRSLSAYFISSVEDNYLFEILEERVQKEGKEEQLIAVAQLAWRCLKHKSGERPSMKEVAVELEGLRNIYEHPWNPNKQEDNETLLGEPLEGSMSSITDEYSMDSCLLTTIEMGSMA